MQYNTKLLALVVVDGGWKHTVCEYPWTASLVFRDMYVQMVYTTYSQRQRGYCPRWLCNSWGNVNARWGYYACFTHETGRDAGLGSIRTQYPHMEKTRGGIPSSGFCSEKRTVALKYLLQYLIQHDTLCALPQKHKKGIAETRI